MTATTAHDPYPSPAERLVALLPTPRVVLAIYLPSTAFLLFSVALHLLRGVDFGLISRDQAQEFHHLPAAAYDAIQAYPLIGFQSTVSGLIWFAGVGIAVITVALRVRRGQLRDRLTVFLAAVGLLTLVLGTDDIFMVHDELAPRYLKILEQPFMVCYVLAIVAILVIFRRTILEHEPALFGLAIFFFAASVGVDHFQEQLDWWPYRLFFEDGFKFLGINGWCGYLVRQCWLDLLAATAASSAADVPAVRPPAGGAPDDVQGHDVRAHDVLPEQPASLGSGPVTAWGWPSGPETMPRGLPLHLPPTRQPGDHGA